ncbi:hypothetical protein [Croceicoccus mobilis]|uniref:Uncharacterized protein n=1 Tax=Croceicoccus mobilis TaxID=1703339 RepID=A0A916Z2U7_9SPHN|nr:hypothetical protein [Croceicoccus mobilis]GGD74141.1 hypothetical protein GCM10010990_24740 [Croceicoccus mobilis]
MPIDKDLQRNRFAQAVRLLGGNHATAQAIGCGERTIRKLLSGEAEIHRAWLESISIALIERGEKCRRLERHINPAFSGNLTRDQLLDTRDDARRHGGRN